MPVKINSFWLFIIATCLFFDLIQIPAGGKWFLIVAGVEKQFYAGLFYFLTTRIKVNEYCEIFKKVSKYFCISYIALMFYVWLPASWLGWNVAGHNTIMQLILWTYFFIWTLISVILTFYLILTREDC